MSLPIAEYATVFAKCEIVSGTYQVTPMGNNAHSGKPFIQFLSEEREDSLSRVRELGNAIQKYLLAVHGGGLIAVFSLAGIFARVGVAPSKFLAPALIFAVGSLTSGLSMLLQIRVQARDIEKAYQLIENCEAKKYTDDEAKEIWALHESGAKNSLLQVV